MKRGQSGLSFVVGIDKPEGASSHDVVNAVRGIFQEKRVGHTGTLDPFATGVLPICVGSATRLSSMLTSDDKFYTARIVFGAATNTDDVKGRVIHSACVPSEAYDPAYACATLAQFLGKQKQLPPVYSAIKVQGKKSYEAARAGHIIHLEPREIEVYSADLLNIVEDEDEVAALPGYSACAWDVQFHVSKGSYIRALARDIGKHVGAYGYLGGLRRTQSGLLSVDDCVSIDALAKLGLRASLDPVALLGLRIIFLSGKEEQLVGNGCALSAARDIFEMTSMLRRDACSCTSNISKSVSAPVSGEQFSLVANNKLVAIYAFQGNELGFVPKCVFKEGVIRGSYL